MIIYLSLLVALVGLLMYVLCKDKLTEIGRIAFFCGLLAFLLQITPQAIGILGK